MYFSRIPQFVSQVLQNQLSHLSLHSLHVPLLADMRRYQTEFSPSLDPKPCYRPLSPLCQLTLTSDYLSTLSLQTHTAPSLPKPLPRPITPCYLIALRRSATSFRASPTFLSATFSAVRKRFSLCRSSFARSALLFASTSWRREG